MTKQLTLSAIPPRTGKPQGANAYFLYPHGSQWCKIINYNSTTDEYEIISWRTTVQAWSKLPKWTHSSRIVLAGWRLS